MKFFNEQKKRVCYLPENQKKIVKYFNDHQDATLVVDFDEFILPTKPIGFDKISEIDVRKLMLSGEYDKANELGVFLKMKNLKELDNRYIDLEYDFQNFPNLEMLLLKWNKKCTNFSALGKIKNLSLWHYKNSDLAEFSELTTLTELRFIQSNIESIKGTEKLQAIKEVSFVGNRNLSFNDITTNFPNVEIVYIESCKNIDINKIIKLFPNVKNLNYFSANELPTLRIILDGFQKLEKLNVAGTKILESDNRYWKEYTNLKEFNFHDRNHHILKRKDFKNV